MGRSLPTVSHPTARGCQHRPRAASARPTCHRVLVRFKRLVCCTHGVRSLGPSRLRLAVCGSSSPSGVLLATRWRSCTSTSTATTRHPDNGDSYDQRPGRLHRPESLAQTPVSASLAPTTGGVQPASWADWWCALSGAQRAYPSKPCTTASRRGRRDPTTATRRGQRSVYAGSANTRSVRPTRALGAFSGSSRARSPCPARWRPPPRHRSHHPDSYGHPPSANIHHRHGSNNPSRLVPRLSPTQAFRSRLPRRAEPRPVTAAEALLLVLRRAYRHVPTAASVPEPARVARSE